MSRNERKFKVGDVVVHKTNNLQKLIVIKCFEADAHDEDHAVCVQWIALPPNSGIHNFTFFEFELDLAG